MIPMFPPLFWISVMMTLRLLGLMASCILLVKHARWLLQWDSDISVAQHQGNHSGQVQISEKTTRDLQWWLLNRDWVSGRPLFLPHPELTVMTDASLLGWGGHL